MLFLLDLKSNSTFENGIVDEEQTAEGQSTETPEDLKDPEKEPGKKGKKALKRDATTLGTSKKAKKTKLEKSLEMLYEMEMQQQLKIYEGRHKREISVTVKANGNPTKTRRKAA